VTERVNNTERSATGNSDCAVCKKYFTIGSSIPREESSIVLLDEEEKEE